MINIKIDSRKVTPGDTFVALKGATVDGHDFIAKAIEAGATKIVAEKEIDCDVETLIVENTNEWLTNYISENYSEEINEMNIIGVTGTNGKTTTAYLTYQILNALGSKTAYIGTIGFYQPDKEFIELPNTTPNILDLYELFLAAKENGCKNVMMEVSSHALHQERVKGINYIFVDSPIVFCARVINEVLCSLTKKPIMIGLTGTSGKTTTLHLLYEYLKKEVIKDDEIAVIGDNFNDMGMMRYSKHRFAIDGCPNQVKMLCGNQVFKIEDVLKKFSEEDIDE